jgi:DNA polymerase-4
LCGNTVKIKLRWSDFTTLTRQVSFTQPIDQDDEIFAAALDLFNKTWIRGRHVRLIGVGVSGLEETRRQLGLFDAAAKEEDRKLQSTLDALRDRFGESIIRRGGDVRPERDDDA